MNNRGGMFLVVLSAIAILLAGFIFLNPMKELITNARGANQLACSDTTISDGIKLICLGMDLVVPLLIIIIGVFAVSIIINKQV